MKLCLILVSLTSTWLIGKITSEAHNPGCYKWFAGDFITSSVENSPCKKTLNKTARWARWVFRARSIISNATATNDGHVWWLWEGMPSIQVHLQVEIHLQHAVKSPFWTDRCRCVTYCSFRSVNCFSRVVISSRHSILLLSQSSSSISASCKQWQVWHQLFTFTHSHQHHSISTSACIHPAGSGRELIFINSHILCWRNVQHRSVF